MPLFWFLVGMSTTVAIICVLLPWIRTIPRFDTLPALPWQAPLAGVMAIAAAVLMYRWLGRPDLVQSGSQTQVTAGTPAGGGAASPAGAGTAGAGSMQVAIASLEARLAMGGGASDDWELLAKSYEFIGRPEAAAKARGHVLPNAAPAPVGPAGQNGVPSIAAASAAVSGEVSLSNSLLAKVPPGGTLFIVAKSVDSPGAPVAAYRGGVANWPVKFTLDDTNAMLPGHNLSGAGRVIIEARISQSGQALPASGDLRGRSGVIMASQRAPVKIVIDEVIQ